MQFEQMMQVEMQKLYDTEVQLMQGLEMLRDKAQNPELKRALEAHNQETQEQIRRLEQICQRQGWDTGGQTSMVTQAMIQEAQQMLGDAPPSPETDAMLIAAEQKAEHLEIACYGTIRALAQQMGNEEAARMMAQSLSEERAMDERLTQLAMTGINQQAVSQSQTGASVI